MPFDRLDADHELPRDVLRRVGLCDQLQDLQLTRGEHVEIGVVGRAAVVRAWLENPDEPGSWQADYEVLTLEGDTGVAHGRTPNIGELRRTTPSSSWIVGCR